ncbi:hypothetical protein, partial [Paraburkholderia aspalathi]|uniref:hypothetical protein n=1 Tax=Paraburkholderia aspalathi TaxID=1324617 RepID=UPI0038BC7D06
QGKAPKPEQGKPKALRTLTNNRPAGKKTINPNFYVTIPKLEPARSATKKCNTLTHSIPYAPS